MLGVNCVLHVGHVLRAPEFIFFSNFKARFAPSSCAAPADGFRDLRVTALPPKHALRLLEFIFFKTEN
jgi:hypothetical protein